MTDTLPSLDFLQRSERESRSTAAVAFALAKDSRLFADAASALERAGVSGNYPRLTKAAASPLEAASLDVLPFNTALLAETDARTVLGRLDPLQIGFLQGVRVQIGHVEAQVSSEGAAKPVATIDLTIDAGRPDKIVAEVMTSEAARALGVTVGGIRRALVAALARATDVHVVQALLASAGSPGGDSVGELLAVVSGGRPVRPAVVGAWSDLLALGELLSELRALGVAIVPTEAAAGTLLVIDTEGLALADAGLQIQSARHASIYLDDGTDPPAPAVVTDLWSRNMIALRVERWLKLAIRPGSVAYAALGS